MMLYVSGLFAQFLLFSVIFLIGAQLLLRPIGRCERFLVTGFWASTSKPATFAVSALGRLLAGGMLNIARRSAAAFLDGHSWRVLAWTLLRFVCGPLGFVFVASEVLLPLALVAAPLVVLIVGLSGLMRPTCTGRMRLSSRRSCSQ